VPQLLQVKNYQVDKSPPSWISWQVIFNSTGIPGTVIRDVHGPGRPWAGPGRA